MKKIEKRAALCLLLVLALFAGLCVFCVRFVVNGGAWASFPSNRHLYNKQGVLINGRILDRNGQVLSESVDGQRTYNENTTVRKATLHAVGDGQGNIGTGAQTAFADQLTGYNFITGAYSITGERAGADVYLTIDAQANKAAYQALDGRRGTVGVYNYKTGEVVCMVSTPTFDPANPPSAQTIAENPNTYNGVYVNRLLSATFTPGSVFKTVTLAAALDTLPDVRTRTFTCTGSIQIGGGTITCTKAHGTLQIGDALAESCNVVFGTLATQVGAEKMMEYTQKAGLLRSLSVSGIATAIGSAQFPAQDDASLAWAGVGQYNDLTNPCNLMVYMGAIANDGVPVLPQLIAKKTTASGIPTSWYRPKTTTRALQAQTAQEIAEMMRGAVVNHYGEDRFAGMSLCAKSGTAEVGTDKKPNAWFTGFSQDEEHPYAFVVMVENGGGGSTVAGEVASKVLRTLFDQ